MAENVDSLKSEGVLEKGLGATIDSFAANIVQRAPSLTEIQIADLRAKAQDKTNIFAPLDGLALVISSAVRELPPEKQADPESVQRQIISYLEAHPEDEKLLHFPKSL